MYSITHTHTSHCPALTLIIHLSHTNTFPLTDTASPNYVPLTNSRTLVFPYTTHVPFNSTSKLRPHYMFMSLPKQSLLSLLVPKFILALPHGRCFGTHIEATIAGTRMCA